MIGKQLGPYTIEAELGSGGMGYWTDWVFLGYCVDQEVYDWLNPD